MGDARDVQVTKPSPKGEEPVAPASLPVHVELARGQAIDRYTIVRRLGAGGMGVVYLAFDPELDRRVAVKILQTTATDSGSEGPARLVREAQVMAKLSHPNVITVFDVGTFGREVFVAMEYVRGVTLREWWSMGPRAAAEVIAICVQAGRGLEAAHERGILHRDFKPENVVVDEHGRARVLDFGLARSRADEPSATGARIELDDTIVGRRSTAALPETLLGAVMGTPAYMAPEQMRSMPVDARSDQFGFCVATFEALYGKRPFPGETVADVVNAIDAGNIVVPPESERATKGVPRAVLPVLVKGLAADPAARWKSMTELLAALEEASTRARRTWLLLGIFAAVLSVAGAVFALGRSSRESVCEGAAQSLAGTWDAPARAEVAAAFRGSGDPNADVALPNVVKALDDYSAAWVAMSTEACVATRVRGVQSDEALDLRAACLRGRLDDLRAFADLLRHADATTIDNAVAGARRLGPLAECADVPALRAAYEPVRSEQRAAVDALRRDVANVVAHYNTGRCDDAMPLAADVATRARALGYGPVTAEALYWAGVTAEDCRDAKTSAVYLFEAVAESTASRQDETAARALIALARVRGSGMSRYEEGGSLAKLAEAAVRRAGSSDALLGDLAHARGWIEYTHGNIDLALPYRKEAILRHQRAVGDNDLDALQMHAELSDLEFESGHLAVALAAQKEILGRAIEMLGPRHQRVGRYTADVAETLVVQGKYEEAAQWIERARPIIAAGPAEHLRYVEAIDHIGLGDVDRGTRELTALIALGEQDVGPADPYPLSVRGDVAKWHSVHRRAEAAAEADAIVQRIGELRQDENPWYSGADAAYAIEGARAGKATDRAEALARHAVGLAEHGASQLPYALLSLGEVLLAKGDAAGARPPLERAIALATERGGIDAIIEGDLDFALARANAGVDVAAARALAASARAAYGRASEPALVAAVDVWSAKR